MILGAFGRPGRGENCSENREIMKTEFCITDMFQKTLISDSVPIFMPSGSFVTKSSRCAVSKISPTKLQWDFPIPERLPKAAVKDQPGRRRRPSKDQPSVETRIKTSNLMPRINLLFQLRSMKASRFTSSVSLCHSISSQI